MLFAILFEDDPELGFRARRRHMQAHLAFLEANADRVIAAGPLKAPDGQPAGGLWVVEAGDVAAVDSLVRSDPFWATGLRRSVRSLFWDRVFADGRRLV